jgi:malate dehydrogenase (oxaloacetate-decarboxylating)(NADP+)
VPDAVIMAYGGKALKMGPDYFIPKPFDPRVLWWVAPAVARAAMESGVARITFDIAEYTEKLKSKGSNAAYSIMRTITKEAQRDPRRIVFPHAANPRLLRAIQQIVDEEIAKPVLLGRSEIEKMCVQLSLDLLSRARNDRRTSAGLPTLLGAAPTLRQRKGITRYAGHRPQKRLLRGADGRSRRRRQHGRSFPAQLPRDREAAARDLRALCRAQVAVGTYMMCPRTRLPRSSAIPYSTSILTPTRSRTSLVYRCAHTVQGFGDAPRVAIISYSNFGSVRHPDVTRNRQALEIVRSA